MINIQQLIGAATSQMKKAEQTERINLRQLGHHELS